MKKFLALFLALTLVLGLCACGGGESGGLSLCLGGVPGGNGGLVAELDAVSLHGLAVSLGDASLLSLRGGGLLHGLGGGETEGFQHNADGELIHGWYLHGMDFVGIYILQYVGGNVKGIWGFCGRDSNLGLSQSDKPKFES